VVLAVDHSKLGSRADAKAFGLDEIDLLVTDIDPADHRLNPYRGTVALL
jgi:DeoR/GlpR family transcriptional regulator of sugar metabolism